MIDEIYAKFCNTKSDINEHLPTLSAYAKDRVVTEFGVRKGLSTIAFLAGRPKKLISYDINIKRFDLGIMEAAEAAAERAEADRIANEARAAEQRRIDAERAELKRQQDEARAAQAREAERLAEVERTRQAAEAAARTRLQDSAQALLDALVLAVPYVANHGTADELAQCNAAIAAATGSPL